MNIKVQKMTAEDENLLAKLYDQHYSQIYLYVYSYIKDENVAKDIASDIFTLACEKFEQIKLHPNPIGWLYLTARNKIREFFRRLEQEPLFLDEKTLTGKSYQDFSHTHSVYSMTELEITLYQSLNADEYRRFIRYFIRGCSIQELAKLEGISYNYMCVLLTRLRKKLRKYLQNSSF
ncbi:MAG: sigma-70 family RNA polymerase sigma factor [Bacteroidales bacterium]|nr:sigma-70 family RNA polymerase sigma factor [Lachnoclostridium sp.]MCM1384366.1 sigma-70 family RNA polymerase sigma factor [Lachnoclostridium sp.]MCM1464947.1 sigma-70 family RNA polymerase sigma factor [Bacteroidales bacterium]